MSTDCFSQDTLPQGMLQNNRTADQNFNPEEDLYWRFLEFNPLQFKLVNQSINRSKHGCKPEWILLPCYITHGYGVFKVRDIPPFKVTSGNIRYDFRVEHVPIKFNYCHSEIRVYKDGIRFNNRIKGNVEMKAEYRMEIFEKIQIIKYPEI